MTWQLADDRQHERLNQTTKKLIQVLSNLVLSHWLPLYHQASWLMLSAKLPAAESML